MNTTATAIPYAVDNDFFAAGYLGDYGAISQKGDTTGVLCGTRAPIGGDAGAGTAAPNAQCWKIVYTVPVTTAGFAGVAWQADLQPMMTATVPPIKYDNNFGVAPGVVPPAGAKEVSFYAKGAAGGEAVTFGVGSAGDAPCSDAEIATTAATLTTTWTKYTIAFPNATYTAGQVTGFSWNAAATTAGAAITFYIDNIVWD